MSNFRRLLLASQKKQPYTELEYIECTGTQYIDTGIVANSDTTSFELDYNLLAKSDTYFYGIVGARVSTDEGRLYAETARAALTRDSYWGTGIGEYQLLTGTVTIVGDNILTYNRLASKTYYINSTSITNITESFSTGATLSLGAIHRQSDNSYLYQAVGLRIKRFKLWGNNVAVMDCIPVLDMYGVPCLFDRVNKEFLYNAGTGTFAYQELNELTYIKSTGTQYIDTGYYPTQDTQIEGKFRCSANFDALWGSNSLDTTTNNCSGFANYRGNFRFGNQKIPYTTDANTDSMYVQNRTGLTVNGVSKGTYPGIIDFTSDLTLKIGYVPTYYLTGRIYYFKVWDNDELILDLVPAMDTAGVICMFDKVNRKYLYNAGTGDFIAGELKREAFVINTALSGTSDTTTFYLPITSETYINAIDVDWGDGNIETLSSGSYPSHSYATAGTYRVAISSESGLSPYMYWSDVQTADYNKSNLMLIKCNTPIQHKYSGSSQLTSCSTYYYCTSLSTVANYLFKFNPSIISFDSCFRGCTSLTSIPTGLFDNNTLVTTFSGCFFNCTSLTSIPTGLFDNNTLVTNFSGCFYNCTSLTSIPSTLFNNTTRVVYFDTCFSTCTSLTSIPSGLFDNIPSVTTFNTCFSSCYSLTSIPSGLFDNNILVTNFYACFFSCYRLTSIPTGLFDNNTTVTTFNRCFNGCANLATVPEYLFRYNTAITNFASTFSDCDKLQLNSNIFCDEATESTTRFANVTPNFTNCFTRSSFSGTQGIAPTLWNYTYASAPTTTGCFGGAGNSVTSISNYADIPSGWL